MMADPSLCLSKVSKRNICALKQHRDYCFVVHRLNTAKDGALSVEEGLYNKYCRTGWQGED